MCPAGLASRCGVAVDIEWSQGRVTREYYRMCSLTIECVLSVDIEWSQGRVTREYYRMCSLTIECVLLL